MLNLLPSTESTWRLNIDIKDGSVIGRREEDLETLLETIKAKHIPVCLVDIDASMNGIENGNTLLHKKLAEVPGKFWYGGGVTNLKEIEKFLNLGAKGVIISSAIYKNGQLNGEFLKELNDNLSQSNYIISVDFEQNGMATKGFEEHVKVNKEIVLDELHKLLGTGANVQLVDVEVSRKRLQPNYEWLQTIYSQYSDIFNLWYGGNISSWEQFNIIQSLGFSPTVGRAYLEGNLGL